MAGRSTGMWGATSTAVARDVASRAACLLSVRKVRSPVCAWFKGAMPQMIVCPSPSSLPASKQANSASVTRMVLPFPVSVFSLKVSPEVLQELICRSLIETLHDLWCNIYCLIEIENHRSVFVTFQHQIVAFPLTNLLYNLTDRKQEILCFSDFSLTKLLCSVLCKTIRIVDKVFQLSGSATIILVFGRTRLLS